MGFKFKIEGLEKVKTDFKAWADSPDKALPSFMNLVESQTLSLLKQNTPKDTGELANSWRTLEKTQNTLEIGVTDDQEDKLSYVISGTKWIPPNNFMAEVDATINQIINTSFASELVRSHRFWHPVQGKINISSTVGLTGTTFNKRRGLARSSLNRPKTGRKASRVRIGRRRRVGVKFGKSIKLG